MLKHINFLFIMLLLIVRTAIASEAPLSYVSNFNSQNYLGTWYEVARLPMFFEKNCILPITAHYAVDSKYPNEILVTNSCTKKTGGFVVAHGVAHFVENPSIGKLRVTFLPTYLRWLPFGHGAYWVIATDYTHYAVVGNPNRRYLWILSRTAVMNSSRFNKLLLLVHAQGFNVNDLIINNKPQK